MKYKISLADSVDLIVTADSEVEAVRRAKQIKDRMFAKDSKSIMDGKAANIVTEIKKQYPQAHVSVDFRKDEDRDGYHYLTLRIEDLPGVDRFDHTKNVSAERFVSYVLHKNGANRPYVSSMSIGSKVVTTAGAFVKDSTDIEYAGKQVNDEIIRYRGARIEKVNSSSRPYMISGFGESYASLAEAKLAVDAWIAQGIRFYDSCDAEIHDSN